jgi:outer membrane immunogenic protein
MKKFLLTTVAFGALAVPAMAADMAPAPMMYKAPVPVPVACAWCGLYIGVNLGWAGSSSDNLTNTGTDSGLGGLGNALNNGRIPATVGMNNNGFIGGGQIGYNWQIAPAWVAGLEADFDGLGKSSNTATFAFPGSAASVPFTSTFTSGLDTLGTVRGRIGYLWTPALLAYATGGLAYGETKLGSTWSCPTCAPVGALALTSTGYSTGWTVGAGLEWQFLPRWSVKAEYLYVDLGSRSETITYAYPAANNSSLTSTIHEKDNIVRAGLNYRFW